MHIDANRTPLNEGHAFCRAELADDTVPPGVKPSIPESQGEQATRIIGRSDYLSRQNVKLLHDLGEAQADLDRAYGCIYRLMRMLCTREVRLGTFEVDNGRRCKPERDDNKYVLKVPVLEECGS